MLSSVLKGPLAIQQSILIMRTFKKMRHCIVESQQLLGNDELYKLTHLLIQDNIKIRETIHANYQESSVNSREIKKELCSIKEKMATREELTNTIDKIMNHFIERRKLKQFIFKDGEIFEANEAYISIYQEAKYSIYIIDDYLSINTLSLLKNKREGIEVVIFSDNKGSGSNKLRQFEFDNFYIEYPTICIRKNSGACHDRFIILDYHKSSEKIYLCGSSSKDAGKKIGAITLLSLKGMDAIIDNLLTHDTYVFK